MNPNDCSVERGPLVALHGKPCFMNLLKEQHRDLNCAQLRPATATENDKNRVLTINGRQCLLLALLWAFDEEKTMFSKYPEVLHHDVKGKVCQWAMPWWFSVGVNGRRVNFIALRGWIHN